MYSFPFTSLALYSLAHPYPNSISCSLPTNILTFKNVHMTPLPEPSQTLSLLFFSPPNCQTLTFPSSTSLPTNTKPYIHQSSSRCTCHLLVETPQQKFHSGYTRHLLVDTPRQRPAAFPTRPRLPPLARLSSLPALIPSRLPLDTSRSPHTRVNQTPRPSPILPTCSRLHTCLTP
jgi:hypothetical protein